MCWIKARPGWPCVTQHSHNALQKSPPDVQKPLKTHLELHLQQNPPSPTHSVWACEKSVHFSVSQLSHTLCGCESSPSRQSQNQHSLLAPWCHLPWSQNHPGCSPCASSSAPGEFVGSCFSLRITLEEILLGGSSWGQSPKSQEWTHMNELKGQQLSSTTSQECKTSARAERRDSPWKPQTNHHGTGTLIMPGHQISILNSAKARSPPVWHFSLPQKAGQHLKTRGHKLAAPVCVDDVGTHELALQLS